MSRTWILTSSRKVAAFLLGALPVALGMMPQLAQPEPRIELLPLPRTLSSQTHLTIAAGPADPRAVLIAASAPSR